MWLGGELFVDGRGGGEIPALVLAIWSNRLEFCFGLRETYSG